MIYHEGPDEDEQEPGDADSEDLEQEALLARREDEEDEPEYGLTASQTWTQQEWRT